MRRIGGLTSSALVALWILGAAACGDDDKERGTGADGGLVTTDDAGHTRVRADVGESALLRYPVDLRALTAGTASFTRRFSRYEPVAGGA